MVTWTDNIRECTLNLDFPITTPQKAKPSPFSFFLGGLAGSFIFFAVCFLLLKWVALPHINRFEAGIETFLTDVVGQKVSLGQISAELVGFTPVISVQNLALGHKESGKNLQIKKLFAELSVQSLIFGEIQFKNLELFEPKTRISHQNGQWLLAGFPFDMQVGKKQDYPLLSFLRDQQRLKIQNGTVNFALNDSDGKPVDRQLQNIQGLWQTTNTAHHLQLATAGSGLAQPLELNAKFKRLQGKAQGLQRLSGDVYLKLIADQPRVWAQAHVLNTLFGVRRWPEKLNTEVWLSLKKGEIQRSTGFVDLENLAIQSFKQPESELLLKNFKTWLYLKEVDFEKGFLQVQFKQLQARIVEQNVAVFDVGPLNGRISRSQQNGQPVIETKLEGIEVDTALLFAKQLAATPWVNTEVATFLANYQASGFIEGVSLAFLKKKNEGTFFDRWSLEGNMQFQDLSVVKTNPETGYSKGFKTISGQVSGSNLAGQWSIYSDQAQLISHQVFNQEVINLTRIKGEGMWHRQSKVETGIDLMINRLEVENQDVQATILGTYNLRTQSPDLIHLSGQIHRAEAIAVPDYLPKIIGQQVRTWLKTNLKSGDAENAQFVVNGPVSKFPYHNDPSSGQFRVEIPFSNAAMTFAPDWPVVSDIDGMLTIDRKSLQLKAKAAKTGQIELSQIYVYIEDLVALEPVLEIQGIGRGSLQHMVEYTKNSPVSFYSGGVFNSTQTEGQANLILNLNVPIKQVRQTTVEGQLELQDTSIQLISSMPWVRQLNGVVSFSNQGVEFSNLTGVALGEAITINGKQTNKGNLRVTANGIATAQGLGDYLNPVLALYLDGQTAFSVRVDANKGQPDIAIKSDLEGLEINLPQPFNKPAAAKMDFLLSRSASRASHTWQANVNRVGFPAAQVKAQVSDKTKRLDYLIATVGTEMPRIQRAIQVNMALDQIDIMAWKTAVDRAFGRIEQEKVILSGLLPKLLSEAEGSKLPLDVQLATNQLIIAGKPFDAIKVRAKTVADKLQFNVKSQQVAGFFSWQNPIEKPQGLLLGHFKHFSIPETLKSDVRNLIREPMKSMPALDIQVDDFKLGNITLGALTLRAENQTVPDQVQAVLSNQPNKWTLTKLELSNPESVTTASGTWHYDQEMRNQKTELKISQRITDAGKLLARLGREGVFQGGQAQIEGTLSWANSPTELDKETLSGNFQVNSQNGQFLKANPGAAKLLGVLSLQGLTRRLTFDFKDLFGQGFAYNDLTANFELTDGVASTQNLKMIGPSATVLMDGKLNLKEETQNLNVVVLPDLNATGGSLIYSLIAANPAVGIASLIADVVLKDPLSKVFSLQYKVTGPWAEPDLERLNLPETSGPDGLSVDNSP